MICPPCRRAGEAITAGLPLIIPMQLHQQCESPVSCPCHHIVSGVKPDNYPALNDPCKDC